MIEEDAQHHETKQVIVTYGSNTPWVVIQAMEAAKIVCKGEPANHQRSQAACPRKKSRSQSMTKIITSDQPSRHHLTMRWLPSSLSTILRRHSMEAILAKLLRSWKKWIAIHGSILWIKVVTRMQPFRQSKISNSKWNSRPIMMLT